MLYAIRVGKANFAHYQAPPARFCPLECAISEKGDYLGPPIEQQPHPPGPRLVSVTACRGPSPLLRGAAVRGSGQQTTRAGTIPACAGSSPPRRQLRTTSRDHPRVRAGSRASRTRPLYGGGDHPRVRGEQQFPCYIQPAEPGPSPHARGADRHGDLRRAGHGTIPACAGSRRGRLAGPARPGDHPACAGSSSAATKPETPPRDHPRVRGEQGTRRRRAAQAAGPSPRARGAGDAEGLQAVDHGRGEQREFCGLA